MLQGITFKASKKMRVPIRMSLDISKLTLQSMLCLSSAATQVIQQPMQVQVGNPTNTTAMPVTFTQVSPQTSNL